MSEAPDLGRVLVGEIERRLEGLEEHSTPARVAQVLHALKGAAAMAGFGDLGLLLAQLAARTSAGDASAPGEALALLATVAARLREGEPPLGTSWPTPPALLAAARIDPRYRSDYQLAMRGRVDELDAALAEPTIDAEMFGRVGRSVHAIKGAAGSVGDDLVAWYAHGLEAWLRSEAAAGPTALTRGQLSRHRSVLAALIADPVDALRVLRRGQEGVVTPAEPAAAQDPGRRPSSPPIGPRDDDAALRLPGPGVDRLLERLERVDLVHEELLSVASAQRSLTTRLRETRAALLEALRLIGPPKPWGAPAAALSRVEVAARTLGAVAEATGQTVDSCRRSADALHARAGEMRAELAGLRRTQISWLFERVAQAVTQAAAVSGHRAEAMLLGSDLSIDRRVAERLLDPLLQLARNAVAHGLAPPEDRRRQGKPETGIVTLQAERMGDWVRVTVEDDGYGVDVERLRQLAVERGMFGAEAAQLVARDDLLALLFAPGLSTRRDADLLAGRGVGLDLAQDAVRRLGGVIRLSSRAEGGLRATVEVPGERSMVEVIWLGAGAQEFALPISFSGRVRQNPEKRHLISLAACLGLRGTGPVSVGIELRIHGVQPISIGVERVGEIETASIRAIPAVVAAAGPFSGAILRGDGSLRLALDPALVAARAWARAS